MILDSFGSKEEAANNVTAEEEVEDSVVEVVIVVVDAVTNYLEILTSGVIEIVVKAVRSKAG